MSVYDIDLKLKLLSCVPCKVYYTNIICQADSLIINIIEIKRKYINGYWLMDVYVEIKAHKTIKIVAKKHTLCIVYFTTTTTFL